MLGFLINRGHGSETQTYKLFHLQPSQMIHFWGDKDSCTDSTTIYYFFLGGGLNLLRSTKKMTIFLLKHLNLTEDCLKIAESRHSIPAKDGLKSDLPPWQTFLSGGEKKGGFCLEELGTKIT